MGAHTWPVVFAAMLSLRNCVEPSLGCWTFIFIAFLSSCASFCVFRSPLQTRNSEVYKAPPEESIQSAYGVFIHFLFACLFISAWFPLCPRTADRDAWVCSSAELVNQYKVETSISMLKLLLSTKKLWKPENKTNTTAPKTCFTLSNNFVFRKLCILLILLQ